MNVPPRYTRSQVARGTRPDAERMGVMYLLKNCSELRLTYQIRLLTYMASTRGRKLVIDVPEHCQIHQSLRDFQKEHSKIVRIEKV
jgi:hypothetical protein